MSQRIEIVRGTTKTLAITVTDSNNDIYTLEDGEKVVFGVKRKPEDSRPVILKTPTSGENGVYAMTITPADTEELPFGKYFFDVGILSGSNYHNIIKPRPFMILPNATKRGDVS